MVDMHIHTEYSDGDFSLEKVFDIAEEKELVCLSITDHDTVSAYVKLKNGNIRERFSGMVIPGVELTTTYNDIVIEILGYGFDLDKMNCFIDGHYVDFEEKQRMQYELLLSEYKKRGFVFDEKNICFYPEFRSWKLNLLNELKKYPDNYVLLLHKNSFDNHSLFFRQEVCNPKSPYFISQNTFYPSLKTVLDGIHNSGGKAFLAHPYIYSDDVFSSLDKLLDDYDIDGIECYYSSFTNEQTNYLLDICKKRGLFVSGGSDCHGSRRKNHDIGVGDGTLNILYDVIKDWI